jgi:CubicO group peptidase (beta-lactamase class C family)
MRQATHTVLHALFALLLQALPLTAAASSGPAVDGGRIGASGDANRFANSVDSLFADWATGESPGAAVLVTDKGETILMRCYGLASMEYAVPITPSTRFELASVSKPFTAFAVLLLEREGKLGLDDDVRRYLPELPDYGSPITIGDLLHHTSGLSDWVKVTYYAGLRWSDQFRLDELMGMVNRQRMLEFEPGTKWSYSNTNYALLAEIVARVTGEPFTEWTRDNVFLPLGMRDTSFPAGGTSVVPDRASAYNVRGDGFARSFVENFEIPGPAHALSTIDDMAKWVDNMRTGRIGGRAVLEEMQTKGKLKSGEEIFYGDGLGMGEYRGLRTAGHSGQTGAFRTELLYCPDVEVGVVVLANVSSIKPADAARAVLDLYLGELLEPMASSGEESPENVEEAPFLDLDPSGFAPFLGGYRLEDDPSVLVGVALEGDNLFGIIVGTGMDTFRPIGNAEFETPTRSCRVTFYGGDDGLADRACIRLRGNEMWASRIIPPPDPGLLDEYAGLYYSNELLTIYDIARDGSGAVVRNPRFGSRPLELVDENVLAGGIGILTFLRDTDGRVVGFDFSEPEDLGSRLVRFARCEIAQAPESGR